MDKISICIPAYNRPGDLRLLLESLGAQIPAPAEILITDDQSPRGEEIASVVEDFRLRFPGHHVRLVRNEQTLGYDGNLRRVIRLAAGDYCLIMADDDLLKPGALKKYTAALSKHPGAGVVFRSYERVKASDGTPLESHRYFPDDRFFPPGADTIAAVFRRSVVIAGIMLHRESALALETAEFDGSLLYQLHLVGNILSTRGAAYIGEPVVTIRSGNEYFFGAAEAEKGRFTPNAVRAGESVGFIRGMLNIAAGVEARTGLPVYEPILRDIGNYSYAFLRMHTSDRLVFARYARDLSRLGLGRVPLFHAYAAGLFVLGRGPWDRLIPLVKRSLGRTPRLGKLYEGVAA